MKLIDKDALVAEINKRMSRICGDDFYAEVKRGLYNSLIIYLNTHEVKEVDLEKEIDDAFLENKCNITDNVSLGEFERIAKHFFELGMQISNKAQKGE